MKNILLMLFAGLTLASCSEISTDPAPTRLTRTNTASLTYSLAGSALATDTLLVNPKIAVYLLSPDVQSDGSTFYPLTTTATPLATVTPTRTSQTLTIPPVTLTDGQPAPIVRLVFTSDNLPGLKKSGSTTVGERITTALYVNNTTTVRATTTYSGLDFTKKSVAPFRKQTDLSIAAY
ncbi:hypothetical protein [Hymenobacter negativus]|uniref:DUF1735 domain-containing protein n=1 Tax=Hymenobacter negativus TaxID=2795026 RepID=A0ABS0Q4L9_9BACT|nr:MULTISPECIES: hypothetical protein [Bacteria]MBH8557616.1 hypothetical protein [Hymenobacter negativus]MBH8567854.1 hypothetical protein [Hymenobacter negativus]MBR7207590.1 hypothetical protein [Microvirga sp. STS02]